MFSTTFYLLHTVVAGLHGCTRCNNLQFKVQDTYMQFFHNSDKEFK